MATSSQGILKPLPAPLGLNSFYCQHDALLQLKLHVKAKSGTLLDIKVTDEDTSLPVFQVEGKLASLSKELQVKTADGKGLYTMKQKKAAIRYIFKACQIDSPSPSSTKTDEIIFTAKAKGGFKKDTFDLSIVFNNALNSGKEETLSLKTGIVSFFYNFESLLKEGLMEITHTNTLDDR